MTNDETARRIRELEAENARLRTDLSLATAEFDAIFDHSQIGIAIVDAQRNITRANRHMLEILGFDPNEELLASEVRNLHPDQKEYEAFGHHYTVMRQTGKPVRFTTRLQNKSGHIIWTELIGQPIDTAMPPDLDKGVLWFGYDLTEYREAHQRLKQANIELESFFNNSMIGVVILRGNRTIHKVNQRLVDIMGGTTPEEFMGRSVREFHLSDEAYEAFGSRFFSALRSKTFVQVEYRLRRLDGTPVWTTISGKALDDDYPADLAKGVIWMIDDISARKKAESQLAEMAQKDTLTGVNNRRHFMDLANRELAGHRRHGRPLSAMMLDIDNFKSINDNYGHAAGDEALQRFANVCTGSLRVTDYLGRIGGDEFAIAMPDTNGSQAAIVAERIRSKVEQDKGDPPMTISIGIAEADADASFDFIIARADKALYRAKGMGRNQVAQETSDK